MGLSRGSLKLLIRLKEANLIPSRGAIVDLGAQRLDQSFLRERSDIEKMAELFGVADPAALPEPLVSEAGSDGGPPARLFWQWLGLDYASIDVDGGPGSIALDLNVDDVPRTALGRYHLVTNFGTTAHVVNQLNAFKIVHDLVAPGGVMLHDLPAQGHINHGLFNYSPKMFWMVAKSNEYRWFYFDYREHGAAHEFPKNLIDELAAFDSDIVTRSQTFRLFEATVVTALQKRFNKPFVPPLDLEGDAADAFLERYRTVFKPGGR